MTKYLETVRQDILNRVGEDYPILDLILQLEDAVIVRSIEKIEELKKPQDYFTTLELYIGYTVGIDQALRILRGENDSAT